MYKTMGMDFAKRITDLKGLEKAGYARARSLCECMTLRLIISGKQANRVGEIISILQNLGSLASDADRMAVIRELTGFERIAATAQRSKACGILNQLKKNMVETDAVTVDNIVKRISNRK